MFESSDNFQIEKITNRDKNVINNVYNCATAVLSWKLNHAFVI